MTDKSGNVYVFDELLTEDQKQDLLENDEDLNFATIAFSEDAELPILLSKDGDVEVGEIEAGIKERFTELGEPFENVSD